MRHPLPVIASAAALCAFASAAFADPAACSARSAAIVTPVVELYTSEGCNSCPPADRWLSQLAAEPNLVALAFHVDYWDRLGWKDRFANAAHTERQARQQAVNGARFSYTPQVVVNGADRKDWPALRVPGVRPAASVQIELSRDGNTVNASVQVPSGGPARLGAYWAVTEQGHVSAVKAGENEGVTLKHDFVVREYRPVGPWKAAAGAATALSYTPALPVDPAHPRQVNLVVVDGDTGRPLQALKLGC